MSAPLQPPADAATFVCPHLDVAHRPGTNLVWSAGFALGWKQLIERAGGPIELAGVDPGEPAAELVRALNQSAAELGPLPPGVALGWAGHAVEPGLSELRRDIAHVFGEEKAVTLPDVPGDRIAVIGGAALQAQFATPFPRRRWPMSWRAQHFECFGLWYDEDEPFELWKRRSEQVVVHFPRYTEEQMANLSDEEDDAAWNQLVAEIRLAGDALSLLVARTGRAATLRGTIERALSYLKDDDEAPNARLTQKECLCLPIVDIRCEATFRDLIDLPIANPLFRDSHPLGAMSQAIRFRLDGGGTDVFSTMRNPFGSALMLPMRWYDNMPIFLLLLVLDRSTRAPLFAAWIEQPAMLIEAPAPPLPQR